MLSAPELFGFAFLLAFINDGLGGGYGTLSSPLLLIFGYPAKVAVPSILFSEAWSESFSSIWHGKFKNINYRTFGFTTAGGIVGIVIAVFVIGVFLAATNAKLYIGGIATVMGLFVIVRSLSWFEKHSKVKDNTNRPLTTLLGAVCGFNKSSTGGGYGPLSTSGFQVLGLAPPKAVGSTILSKGVACIISTVLWAGLVGINWEMALPMTVGAFVGAPIASWVNNQFKLKVAPPFHGRLLGVLMAALGAYTVLHVLGVV
jgi:hypothetical protein